MWIFEMESFKFPIIVLIREPNQDLFFQKKKKNEIKVNVIKLSTLESIILGIPLLTSIAAPSPTASFPFPISKGK